MMDMTGPRPPSGLWRIFLLLLCVVFMLCSACGAVVIFGSVNSGFQELGLLAFATACFLVFLLLSVWVVRVLRGPGEQAEAPGSGGGNHPGSAEGG
jgi:hypothetical protein